MINRLVCKTSRFFSPKLKDSSLSVIKDKEKRWIVTFERFEPDYLWLLCLKNLSRCWYNFLYQLIVTALVKSFCWDQEFVHLRRSDFTLIVVSLVFLILEIVIFKNRYLILSVVVFAVRLCRVCQATLSTFLWVVVSRWCSGRDVRLAQREAGKLRWLMVCTEHRTDPTGEQRDEGESLGSLLSWEFKRREEDYKV